LDGTWDVLISGPYWLKSLSRAEVPGVNNCPVAINLQQAAAPPVDRRRRGLFTNLVGENRKLNNKDQESNKLARAAKFLCVSFAQCFLLWGSAASRLRAAPARGGAEPQRP
jgi:hypothetical protein